MCPIQCPAPWDGRWSYNRLRQIQPPAAAQSWPGPEYSLCSGESCDERKQVSASRKRDEQCTRNSLSSRRLDCKLESEKEAL
ncbi:hypothetical protein NDU88_004552 [Pleurodeles waltl]|uniref:Uncharacterized protein n=1 Tax=Pleurodeles waltl TaxID=8319 RepID=A0AAV7RJI2_PLEWA|nr:hypothetical protein NDU88_004552 [Pleurodeles waltl]